VGCEIEDPSFEALTRAEARFGIVDGAGYRIEVPDNWNGTLVLWFHGFTGLNEAGTGFRPDLVFGDLPPRELLLAAGTAWAASTNGAGGYVPAVAVDDLLAVKDIVGEEFGPADQVYAVGGSMGGAGAQLVAQEFPEEIDGALAVCGALSNVEVVDVIASWHALALWFIGDAPSRVDAVGLVEWSRPLGRVDGSGALQLSARGEQFVSVVEALTGGPRWGFREGLARQWERGFELGILLWPDVIGSAALEEPGGAVEVNPLVVGAIDTQAVEYRAATVAGIDLVALNREVVRFASDPVDRANPAIGVASGRLEVPLLTLKGTGDLFTPISLDRSYLRRVRAAGWADQLVMRAVRRAGHCEFTTAEFTRALFDLAAWARGGERPPGEDLSGDLSAAGVAFTTTFDADDPLAR
jgi:pimeloyl-ACP methyl ester carboxylesterase